MPVTLFAYCHKLQQQPHAMMIMYRHINCIHLSFDKRTLDKPSIMVINGSFMERLFHQVALSLLQQTDMITGININATANKVDLLKRSCV